MDAPAAAEDQSGFTRNTPDGVLRPPGRPGSGTRRPEPRHGTLLLLATLALLLTAGRLVQTWAVYPGLLFTEFGLLLLPTLTFCYLQGWSVPQVLMLGRGRGTPAAGAVGIGLLAFAMVLALTFPLIILILLAGGSYPGLNLPLETGGQFALALLAGAVAAPLCEEILFRGFLLRSLAPFGPHAAVWVTAVLFGIFHMDPVRFIPTMALGVVYGYLAAGTGSVRAPMIAHAVNNGLALTLAFLGGGGGEHESLDLAGLRGEVETAIQSSATGLEATLSADLILAVAAGMMLVAGLVLMVMVHLALRGVAGPGTARFRAFIPEGSGSQPLADLARLPAIWAVGAIGLWIWAVGLRGIFGS